MPTLAISNFNLVCALLGGFVILFGLVSYLVRGKMYISEALPSLLFGTTFKVAGLFRPTLYGTTTADITREFTRLVLGVQLVIGGVQLPGKYLWHEWRSLFMLLVPVMTTMWIVSALIIYLCIPKLNYLDALIIGACVTPTDPVLSNSIVKGRFAETSIAEPLRNLISAESGANDGFGYPFLFLALYILRDNGAAIARDWIVETIIYEIILSIVYGAVIGYIAMRTLHFAKEKNMVDDESFVIFVFALALFIVGTAGLVGTDDLLACFVAGNVFTCDWFRVETEEDSLQSALDMILNVAMFTWLGTVIPWTDFNTPQIPVWRFVVMGLAILVFRRLPIVLVLHKAIPRVESFREAIFAGFFGPIGVGAVFYLSLLLDTLATFTQTEEVAYIANVAPLVIYFLVVSSVIVHGISIPALVLGPTMPRTLSRSLTQLGSVTARQFSTFSRSMTIVERAPELRITHRNIATSGDEADELDNIYVVDIAGNREGRDKRAISHSIGSVS
ncbi:Sodium/hydrogen exchanger family-domain-containing protein [Lipomyces kononenkoae]|uniref:Sodium/hydrogen exchanger family-domain-containing protein n=1 Tax=Lipomyces kononenkoae TaxID=34357 RepID=A0ACC3T9I9_LIPKO